MIGIVVPAHNEADAVDACLRAVIVAAAHRQLQGEIVRTIVVLDDCVDSTAPQVGHYPVQALSVAYRNVGRSRAAGAEVMLALGAKMAGIHRCRHHGICLLAGRSACT